MIIILILLRNAILSRSQFADAGGCPASVTHWQPEAGTVTVAVTVRVRYWLCRSNILNTQDKKIKYWLYQDLLLDEWIEYRSNQSCTGWSNQVQVTPSWLNAMDQTLLEWFITGRRTWYCLKRPNNINFCYQMYHKQGKPTSAGWFWLNTSHTL